ETNQLETIINLLKNPKKLLATILIANNFINILFILVFSYFGKNVFGGITSPILKFFIEIVLVTFLILLFGEVLPKVYANRYPLKFTLIMAKPIQFLNYIFSFLSIPLINLTDLIEKKLEKKQTDISVETLGEALKLASNDTTDEEKKILEGIVTFGNTEVIQVMRPRIDLFTLPDDEKFEDVLKKITKNGHSRIPVYKENIDNIIGVLYVKDLLPHLDKKKFEWQKLLREPFFVPENKKLDDLLLEFKNKKNHMAIVVDEYGGTSGIVTLEDIIEEIVGDINDEFDDSDLSYSKLDEKKYIFDAKVSLKDLFKIINLNEEDFEEAKGEAETLAGFILELFGKFPKKGDTIKLKNLNFIIESVDKKRIKQVKVSIQ
ncbi:MAG TPA: gliding motility-associated protein GldE, partial [Flavobacteriia bacterium]|nr:gliding motility-associated protein GldE [Flavobacteriia bacterium]